MRNSRDKAFSVWDTGVSDTLLRAEAQSESAEWTAVVDIGGHVEVLDVLGVEDAALTCEIIEADVTQPRIRVLCLIPEYHADDIVLCDNRSTRAVPTGLMPGNERFMNPFDIVAGG